MFYVNLPVGALAIVTAGLALPTVPDAKFTIIAKCTVQDKRIVQTGFIPCLVDRQAAPHVLGHDAQGQAVFDYMETITRAADLNSRFEWKGDEILVCDAQEHSKADFPLLLLSNLSHWEARA